MKLSLGLYRLDPGDAPANAIRKKGRLVDAEMAEAIRTPYNLLGLRVPTRVVDEKREMAPNGEHPDPELCPYRQMPFLSRCSLDHLAHIACANCREASLTGLAGRLMLPLVLQASCQKRRMCCPCAAGITDIALAYLEDPANMAHLADELVPYRQSAAKATETWLKKHDKEGRATVEALVTRTFPARRSAATKDAKVRISSALSDRTAEPHA
jgi:hypothetical protein